MVLHNFQLKRHSRGEGHALILLSLFIRLSLNFLSSFRFATHMDTEEAKKKGGWGVERGLLPRCNLLV